MVQPEGVTPIPGHFSTLINSHLIIIGLIANTCIESTARYASDIGYHVTLVRDATAAFSHEAMHAAHDINAPSFAHAVLTTAEVLAALP